MLYSKKAEIKKLFGPKCLTDMGFAEGQSHCFHSGIKLKFLCLFSNNVKQTYETI